MTTATDRRVFLEPLVAIAIGWACVSPRNSDVTAGDAAPAGTAPTLDAASAGSDGGAAPDAGGTQGPGSLPRLDAAADWPDPGPAANARAFVPVEGARLKRPWYGASATTPYAQGMPASLESWYDSELHTPCTFAPTSDGELRCLPEELKSLEFYVDAGCTVPALMFISTSCTPPDILRFSAPSDSTCERKYRYLRRGPRINGTTLYDRAGSTGQCTQSVVSGLISLLVGTSIYGAGEEVLPDRFVKGVRMVRPSGGGGVNLVLVQGEDGSLGYGGLEHATARTACRPYTSADGQYRCVPSTARPTEKQKWADAACTQPAVSAERGCGAPTVALEPRGGACPETSEVHLVTAAARTISEYEGATGRCTPATNSTADPLYTLGAVLADSGFPGTSFINEEPAGPRLRRRILAFPSGAGVVWNELWDDVAKASCIPRKFPSGKYRCVPPPGELEVITYYSDAQCTQLLWHGVGNHCVPSHASVVDIGVCPPQDALFTVGAKHTGPVFERSAACGPHTPRNGESFHALTPVTEDQLPEITFHAPP